MTCHPTWISGIHPFAGLLNAFPELFLYFTEGFIMSTHGSCVEVCKTPSSENVGCPISSACDETLASPSPVELSGR